MDSKVAAPGHPADTARRPSRLFPHRRDTQTLRAVPAHGSKHSLPLPYNVSSTATRYFQKSATESISMRSPGECGNSICGPKLIICIEG